MVVVQSSAPGGWDDDSRRTRPDPPGRAPLEKALVALRNQLGPHLDVLRLLDDLDRCTADLRRLESQVGAPRRHELVAIPDGDYDHGGGPEWMAGVGP